MLGQITRYRAPSPRPLAPIEGRTSLLDLPDDVLCLILFESPVLGIADIVRVMGVCRRLRQVLRGSVKRVNLRAFGARMSTYSQMTVACAFASLESLVVHVRVGDGGAAGIRRNLSRCVQATSLTKGAGMICVCSVGRRSCPIHI